MVGASRPKYSLQDVLLGCGLRMEEILVLDEAKRSGCGWGVVSTLLLGNWDFDAL